VTPNKGSGPQVWDTVYISEFNGARKVKSEAQVAMNKNCHRTPTVVKLPHNYIPGLSKGVVKT